MLQERFDEPSALAAVSCSFAEWSLWMLELGVEDGEAYGDSGRFHLSLCVARGLKRPGVMNPRGATYQVFFPATARACVMGERKSREILRNFRAALSWGLSEATLRPFRLLLQ